MAAASPYTSLVTTPAVELHALSPTPSHPIPPAQLKLIKQPHPHNLYIPEPKRPRLARRGSRSVPCGVHSEQSPLEVGASPDLLFG